MREIQVMVPYNKGLLNFNKVEFYLHHYKGSEMGLLNQLVADSDLWALVYDVSWLRIVPKGIVTALDIDALKWEIFSLFGGDLSIRLETN